jgi:hypothetical protein
MNTRFTFPNWMLALSLFIAGFGVQVHADILQVKKPVAVECKTPDGYKVRVAKGQTVGEAQECEGEDCQHQGIASLEIAPPPIGVLSTSEWLELICKDCDFDSPLLHGLIALPARTLEVLPKSAGGSYFTVGTNGELGEGQKITCKLNPNELPEKNATIVITLPAPAKPAIVAAAPKPALPKVPLLPTVTVPSKEIKADLLTPNCAEKIVLKAAKSVVATKFDNRPMSVGKCAMGVRMSLEKSKVGGITDSLNNAIDFLQNLKAYGFTDSGLRDPLKAPPGAIIIFDGPDSKKYLKTGHYSKLRPGDYLGHVTIKGDDGYYYTDGRTRKPAVGWSTASKNVMHVRNVVGIYVPNESLIAEYKNQCN